MNITFLGSLIFCLVFLAIVTFLGETIKAEKWRVAAKNFAIALALLIGAWLLGGGKIG